MGTINKPTHCLIAGGMRFASPNACAHRMSGIGKLLGFFGVNSFLLGVGDRVSKGRFDSFPYETIVYPSTFLGWARFSFSAQPYLSLLKARPEFDCVLVNGSVPSIPTIKIARFCKKKGIPFVFDMGEWYSVGGHSFVRRAMKRFDIFLKTHFICKKYQNFVVASSFLANHCGPKKNVMILPTLVSEKLPISPRLDKRRFPHPKISLSFVGTIEKNGKKEDLRPLIAAISRFNQSHSLKFSLDVIGCSGESSEWVSFHGRKPYSDCIDLLTKSDFSVIPRGRTKKNQSGFPTKLSESFLYGVPAIATDTSDIKDYLFDGINGFLIPRNEARFFEECFGRIEQELSKDESFLQRMSENVIATNKLVLNCFAEKFGEFLAKLDC